MSEEFHQYPIACRTHAGQPYVRWIQMPALPDQLLDCVVYLYKDKESAQTGKSYGGCGFLLSVPSSNGTPPHAYLVTNYHVAVKEGFCVARLNDKAGGVDFFEFDSSDFIFNADGGDVCAVSIQLADIHKWTTLDLSHLSTKGQAEQGIYFGDDVFMLGRFIEHDGGLTNRPAARFGNISVQPGPIKGLSNSAPDCPYYCLDMHSRSGYSGSPVWAYRSPCANLRPLFLKEKYVPTPVDNIIVYGMLGIHCGQFPEELGPYGDAKGITGYSGMTIALPAWKIIELVMNNPKFIAQRKAIEKAPDGAGNVILESATEDDSKEVQNRFEATITRMVNTPSSSKKKITKKRPTR